MKNIIVYLIISLVLALSATLLKYHTIEPERSFDPTHQQVITKYYATYTDWILQRPTYKKVKRFIQPPEFDSTRITPSHGTFASDRDIEPIVNKPD